MIPTFPKINRENKGEKEENRKEAQN